MEHQEHLEWAAKAAGYTVHSWIADDGTRVVWAPHEDDGDALRLAVKLEMRIDFPNEMEPCVSAWVSGYNPVVVLCSTDPYAATRLAILRAAAEVGRMLE